MSAVLGLKKDTLHIGMFVAIFKSISNSDFRFDNDFLNNTFF